MRDAQGIGSPAVKPVARFLISATGTMLEAAANCRRNRRGTHRHGALAEQARAP